MRLNNRNKAPVFNFLLTVVNVAVGIGILLFILEKTKLQRFGHYSLLFLLIPLLILGIFILAGRQIFEYDSDGEALNFKNRNIVPLLGREARDEFPKYKLISYEVVNGFIFKRLYVKISSKKNHSTVLKYDVTYLSSKEIKDLKFSLSKIIKANKEHQKANNLESRA